MFFALWPSLIWGLIINVVMTAWVYSDAKDRDHPEPATWAVVVLLLGVFGLIAYLLKRPVRKYEPTRSIEPKPEPKRGRVPRALTVALKIFGIVWIGSLLALGLSYMLLYSGMTKAAEFMAMVSTGTLVLSTMILFPLVIVIVILALFRR